MRTSTQSRFGLFLIVALVAVFAAVPAASAQDSGNDPSAAQYDTPIPETSGGDSGLNSTIGSLPFTGMDLLIIGGVAFVLTGTGFALRRLSTPRGPGV